MALTAHQLDQIDAWMRDHFDELLCPLCKGEAWQFREIITGLRVDSAGEAHTNGTMRPMLQVVCVACRHVLLFDAVAMGLLTLLDDETRG
jgi:hypothetical protein